MVRLVSAALAGALAFGPAALATAYECTNDQLEVTCGQGRCERSEAFTHTIVVLDMRRRMLTACVYSGCWRGPARVVSDSPAYVLAEGRGLLDHGPVPSRRDVALVVDKRGRSASLVTMGFHNPMTCVVK